MNYAKFIDHTLLKPESTRQQIDQIIDEAKEYNFKSIYTCKICKEND